MCNQHNFQARHHNQISYKNLWMSADSNTNKFLNLPTKIAKMTEIQNSKPIQVTVKHQWLKALMSTVVEGNKHMVKAWLGAFFR